MSTKRRQQIFEFFFWGSIAVGVMLTLAILGLGWLVYAEGYAGEQYRGEAGIALATGALAVFTSFLWLAAAITARFARSELSASTAVNSADLTLQIDNRSHSDRALRIRHGAVTFLAKKRNLQITCDCDISPYSTDEDHLWHGLSSDLIDLFNYYDWIGYLTSDEGNAIDREVVRRKMGPWIVNYYQMCAHEISCVKELDPHRWTYLRTMYDDLMKRQREWYEERALVPPGENTTAQLNAFLKREHIRSHRGLSGTQELAKVLDPPSILIPSAHC